jgi:predicted nucleic acid-binding protein
MRGPNALAPSVAEKLLAEFLVLPIKFHSPPGMHQLALRIADTYGLPAAYDAHYLAVSQLLDCEFWTDDLRLLRQVPEHRPVLRWLRDFVEPR